MNDTEAGQSEAMRMLNTRTATGGRRQHSGPDEFEPLNARQDVVGPDGGRVVCGKARRWLRCCWTAEALFALLGVLMLVYLSRINTGVRLSNTASNELDIKALESQLDAFETDFFTLYTLGVSSEVLLMEFPAAVVAGTTAAVPIIFGASFARGAYGDDSSTLQLLHYPAENTAETVFTFRLTEDMRGVDVLREELTLRTTDAGMVESLANSAPPEWVATLPVLDIRKGKTDADVKILTNAEALLLDGFFVTDIQQAMIAGVRIKLSETRAYPTNAALTVEYRLNVPDLLGKIIVMPLSLRFSISALPTEPMRPRRSDERVGFFTTVFRDLGDHRTTRTRGRTSDLLDTKVTLINRRRIKGDDDPLMYYIDPSVPAEWRPYIREGVESWQPAFEAVGLGKKAIKAVLPEDDDWPQDYNAGDIRFNSITWAVDPKEVFALGPSTLDPRTGEILHSAIVFTDGWVSNWEAWFELYGFSPTSDKKRLLESTLERKHSHSHSAGHAHHHVNGRQEGGGGGYYHDSSSSNNEHHHDHDHDRHQHTSGMERATVGAGNSGDIVAAASTGAIHRDHPLLNGGRGARTHGASGSLRYHGRDACQEARLHDVSMSLLPLVAAHHARSRSLSKKDGSSSRGSTPGIATTEILGAGLRDVVMHEVGHTLGLRHNFEGSTAHYLSDLQNVSKTSEEGLTSSVMDYLPVNMVSSKLQGTEEPHYFTTKLGPYDMWAIKYGYMQVEGEEILEEHADLVEVASAALPFSTDEDGGDPSGMNPLNSVFDLGKDPLDYYEDRLDLVTELQPLLLDRTTHEGEAFTRYGIATGSLLREVLWAGQYACKFVGGFDISKQRRIDVSTPGPVQLVSADQQRRALALIHRIVVGDEPGGTATFLPVGDDFSNMATMGGWCEGLEQVCYAMEPVDVLSKVSTLRKQILLELFSARRVKRMRLQTWTNDESVDSMTTAEMFQTTTDAVWGESGFASERAKLWANWDMMLFWLDLLQAYGSASVASGIPGDVAAVAAGMVYSIMDSGANVTASDPAYGLYRAASRKVNSWEIVGTDGALLALLNPVLPPPR